MNHNKMQSDMHNIGIIKERQLFFQLPLAQPRGSWCCFQAENLAIIGKIEGISSSCIRLLCTCDVLIGSVQRHALILQPKAEQIPLDITHADLLSYVRSLVDALQCMRQATCIATSRTPTFSS